MRKRAGLPGALAPSGAAHDGDTFGLQPGGNARLFGVDAFELNQSFGIPARDFLRGRLPGGVVTPTGASTYGRPVVTLDTDGNDVGRSSVDAGLSIPVPQYLGTDPVRLKSYVSAQRDAIAAERGAYAGTYQRPDEYRRHGKAAPLRGKVPMSPAQATEYSSLVRNPKTNEADLSAWFAKQGRAVTNGGNILEFIRRNPRARVSTYFQQQDVQDAPVLPNGPGFIERNLAALPEGVVDLLGAPVDIVNTFAGIWRPGAPFAFPRPIHENPTLGSEWFREPMHRAGIGQTSEAFAPRSTPERFIQALVRGVGQSVVPVAGSLGWAARAGRGMKAFRPVIAGEIGGGVGGETGWTIGDTIAPGNPWVQMGSSLIGGVAGGFGGAAATAGRGRTVAASASDSPPVGYNVDAGVPGNMIERMVPGSPVTPSSSSMSFEGGMPTVTARPIDRIDVGTTPAGYTLDPPLTGAVRPMVERATPEAIADMARGIEPGDVTSIPSNAVESVDEAAAISSGMRPPVVAPNETAALGVRALPATRNPQGTVYQRGPLDLAAFLRRSGGLRDGGGDLAHMGIDNAPRPIDFARNEQFLGKLVDPENGMTLDDAARKAWEAGYFPDSPGRPAISEFLDALHGTHTGARRVFHPDDYSEVDAFTAVQSQRHAVEKAADDGAPMVQDRGQPIGPDDLEANRAPATAYEDLPRVSGKVGNINLAHIETPQDIRRVLSATEARMGGFDAARRDKVSHAETEALAAELGMTPADLLKRRKGQALNAEESLAARQILAKSSNELVNLAGRARGGSEADLASFREAWLRHAAIQEHVTAATAEAGRSLSQFRMAAKSSAIPGRIHKLLIEQAGGRDHLEDVAGKILDLVKLGEGPGQVTKFAADAVKPRFRDKLVELWYNSLLSGPQTHVVNVTSNFMTAGLQIPEHAGAALIGGARRAVGLGDPDRVLFSEVGSRAFAMMQGARDGLRAFARTAKTGVVPDHVTKVEAATQEAISGLKGKILRTPTRLLSAEDEFFKAVARRSEMAGLVVRKARSEGLKGEAMQTRIAELLANPPEDMIDATLDYARYVTFQRPTTGIAAAVSSATQSQPALKLFIPFVRTPVNILAFAAERSPLAPVVKAWRADVASGGARRDLAIARATMGTGLGALITKLAADGHITGGGPADDNAKQIMRADGWQPYSIKIGDRYYSYQRLDPLATTLGTAADLATKGEHMTEGQRNEAAGVITASILQNLSNKTWLSGMSDMVEMLHDPQRYAGTYARNLAGSVTIPTLSAQIARTVDPVMRETNTIPDAIRSRVPGLSQGLPPRLNVWGQPVIRAEGVGPDLISPFTTQTAKHDPVNAEMLAIDARFGDPSRKVGGRRLNDTEWHDYRADAGQGTYASLSAAMRRPDWRDMTLEERADMADRIKRDARASARGGLTGVLKPSSVLPPGFRLDAPPAGYVLDR